MSPQRVSIHGRTVVLQQNGGGGSLNYRVTDPRTGAVVAQHARRFMALAIAAQTLRSVK